MLFLLEKRWKFEICIDFRKLNSLTIKDAHTLPRIDDTIDTLICAKYFPKLDLRSGYWQVEIRKRRHSLLENLGFYECNGMAFRLINAPATF